MSNVLRRKRSISEVEFLDKAKRIRTEITRIAMNEKAIPKRYRFVYSIPMIDICRDLMKNANTYYNCVGEDDDHFHLYERKRTALENMLDCCSNLLSELQSAREQFYIKMSVRELVVGLIVDEEELIKFLLEDEKEKHINFSKNNIVNRNN